MRVDRGACAICGKEFSVPRRVGPVAWTSPREEGGAGRREAHGSTQDRDRGGPGGRMGCSGLGAGPSPEAGDREVQGARRHARLARVRRPTRPGRGEGRELRRRQLPQARARTAFQRLLHPGRADAERPGDHREEHRGEARGLGPLAPRRVGRRRGALRPPGPHRRRLLPRCRRQRLGSGHAPGGRPLLCPGRRPTAPQRHVPGVRAGGIRADRVHLLRRASAGPDRPDQAVRDGRHDREGLGGRVRRLRLRVRDRDLAGDEGLPRRRGAGASRSTSPRSATTS